MTESPSDHDLLIAMNTKLDVALRQIGDHEERLRTTEARLVVLTTLAGAVGAGGGWGLTRLFGA